MKFSWVSKPVHSLCAQLRQIPHLYHTPDLPNLPQIKHTSSFALRIVGAVIIAQFFFHHKAKQLSYHQTHFFLLLSSSLTEPIVSYFRDFLSPFSSSSGFFGVAVKIFKIPCFLPLFFASLFSTIPRDVISSIDISAWVSFSFALVVVVVVDGWE